MTIFTNYRLIYTQLKEFNLAIEKKINPTLRNNITLPPPPPQRNIEYYINSTTMVVDITIFSVVSVITDEICKKVHFANLHIPYRSGKRAIENSILRVTQKNITRKQQFKKKIKTNERAWNNNINNSFDNTCNKQEITTKRPPYSCWWDQFPEADDRERSKTSR